jgi:hypothetical protein
MKQLFDPTKPRYMTSDIKENLPIELTQYLWNCIEESKKETVLDYLQVFKLDKIYDPESKRMKQLIVHSQEEPMYTKEYLVEIVGSEGIKDTVFVIDDIDHQTILFSRNY